jgi:hypothetical protein
MVRFLAVAIALALSAPAQAAPALEPLRFNGVYVFSWGGLSFGEMALRAHEEKGRFEAQSTLKITGLARVFTSMDSRATLSGERGTSWGKSPREYETYYTSKSKARHVKLVYGKSGSIVEEVVEPVESREKRPAVKPELKAASLDPLSYIFAVREALHKARAEGDDQFTIRLYDGRRLMDTTYTIQAEKGGMIGVTGSRVAVDGFTAKELKRLATEPKVSTYFTDDEKLIPLRLELPLPLGVATAKLAYTCEGEALCSKEDESQKADSSPQGR